MAGINLRELHCPVCDKVIGDWERRENLTKEILDEIAERELKELLKTNPNLRKCPCGAIMEVT